MNKSIVSKSRPAECNCNASAPYSATEARNPSRQSALSVLRVRRSRFGFNLLGSENKPSPHACNQLCIASAVEGNVKGSFQSFLAIVSLTMPKTTPGPGFDFILRPRLPANTSLRNRTTILTPREKLVELCQISIYKYVPCMCVYGHVRVHIGIGTHASNGEKYIVFTFTCDRVFTHMRMYHGDFGD